MVNWFGEIIEDREGYIAVGRVRRGEKKGMGESWRAVVTHGAKHILTLWSTALEHATPHQDFLPSWPYSLPKPTVRAKSSIGAAASKRR